MTDYAGLNRQYWNSTGQFVTQAQSAATFLDVLGNTMQRPDGATQYVRPILLTGQPIIIPSSGTVGNNGALSGITALAATYSNGCWMFFPSGALFAGSVAAVYWVVMSSATAGTVFMNTIPTGQPGVPTLAPIVATGPGAYTQTTGSNLTLLTISIPANSLGPNGAVEVYGIQSNNNSANTKSTTVSFGNMQLSMGSNTTNLANSALHLIVNRGVTNSQVSIANTGFSATAAASTVGTVDTTAVVSCTFLGQLVTAATDTVQYDAIRLNIIYGP